MIFKSFAPTHPDDFAGEPDKLDLLLAAFVGPKHPTWYNWHLSRLLGTQTGMSNDWLKRQGLISIRDQWMNAHGYA